MEIDNDLKISYNGYYGYYAYEDKGVVMNTNGKKIKVGVGFATGRKNFINSLKCQYKNWKDSGLLNGNISLNVFIAYDVSYNNINKEEFIKIPKYLYEGIDNIFFIGEEEIKEIYKTVRTEKDLCTRETREIFDVHGYGKLRNSILYTAINKNIDYLLFMDDDEYPVAPLKDENGNLTWKEQNILKTHLDHIKDCDITFGHHCRIYFTNTMF